MVFAYCSLYSFLRKQAGVNNRGTGSKKKMQAFANKVVWYPIIFVFCWTAGTINRVNQAIDSSNQVYWLLIAHVSCKMFEGAFNAIAYSSAIRSFARKKGGWRVLFCPPASRRQRLSVRWANFMSAGPGVDDFDDTPRYAESSVQTFVGQSVDRLRNIGQPGLELGDVNDSDSLVAVERRETNPSIPARGIIEQGESKNAGKILN
jgi:hypothetical protein